MTSGTFERVINITFHAVGPLRRAMDDGEAALSTTAECFEEILDESRRHECVRITFDDGNSSDVEIALPALLDRGLRATFFVVAGRLGEPGFVSPAGVTTLVDAGMEVGLHGMNHRPWRRLSPSEAHEELVAARELVEMTTRHPIESVACPYGAYDRRLLRRLARLGYRRVYTSDGGWARTDSWLQSRTSVRRGDGAELVRQLVADARRSLRRDVKSAIKRWR